MKNNILLIGFMGVGKGTIARALVKKGDFFAIDTDDLIESIENRKIKKIFEEDGEPYFRKLETQCALWCENNVSSTIISTGGGFYRQPNIKRIGTVIYLESPFETIIESLTKAPDSKKKFKKRPLLGNLEEAKKIYDLRIEEYKKVADITVDVSQWDIDKITDTILDKLQLKK